MSKTLENGSFQDAVGTVVNGGTIEFVLSHDAMIIVGGQVAPTRVSATLDSSGDMPSAFTILANDELTPAGTFYLTTVFDSNGARVFGPERWVFSGTSPIDLDTMTPTIVDPAFADPILSNPVADQTITGFDLLPGASGLDLGSLTQTWDSFVGNLTFGNSSVVANLSSTNNLQVHCNNLLIDQISDGQQDPTILLRSNGTSANGKGGFIRWEVLDSTATLRDAAQLGGGYVDATARDSVLDVVVEIAGVTRTTAFSGSLEAFTPADTNIFSLGTIGTAGTAGNRGWKELSLESTTPRIQFYENDETLPDGLWRLRASGGSFQVIRNTAVAGDFGSLNTDFSISSAGTVSINKRLVQNTTLTLDDTGTPSISAGNVFTTGGTTAITAFDNGANGQVIYIVSAHTVTITDGSALNLSGAANYGMTADDTLTLVFTGTNWYELARSVN